MSPEFHQHTAKIYQFPRKIAVRTGRQAMELERSSEQRPRIDWGSWYHQAAIEDAQRTRK